MKIGIDFGTTNSAVAVLGPGGTPTILELAPGERTQRTVIHCSTGGTIRFGNAAFRSYVEADLTGRFLRSLKSFLSQEVPRTMLGHRRYAFHELVTAYLRFLVDGAEAVTGERVTEVVVGRPVHFHRDPERDAAASGKLEAAISAAGLPACRLQLEPVAAAHRYEQSLTEERLVLVGDFGGGTSDFAILRAGPSRHGDRADDILATSGVAAAGDVLDGRFLDAFLMEPFGRGAAMKSGEVWNHAIHKDIRRLYYIHLLRTEDLRERLHRLEHRMEDPRVIRRLQRLVFDDLGYPMAWAIERSKRQLSESDTTLFRFEEFYSDALDIEREVDVATFADACSGVLDAYQDAISAVLRDAGLQASDIDHVFLTGGTSQLSFVRELFARRFGAERLRGADAFTTVCEGLALAR